MPTKPSKKPMTDDDPTASYTGTCDAGNCHRITAAVILVDGKYWLSACKPHSLNIIATRTQ